MSVPPPVAGFERQVVVLAVQYHRSTDVAPSNGSTPMLNTCAAALSEVPPMEMCAESKDEAGKPNFNVLLGPVWISWYGLFGSGSTTWAVLEKPESSTWTPLGGPTDGSNVPVIMNAPWTPSAVPTGVVGVVHPFVPASTSGSPPSLHRTYAQWIGSRFVSSSV